MPPLEAVELELGEFHSAWKTPIWSPFTAEMQ